MAIDWGTIKSLLIFFGPLLLPKAIGYYRSVCAAPRVHGLKPRPLPPRIARAIVLLLVVAAVLLVRALPWFAPENVFAATQSRLQIPTDVLFTRLASLRPRGRLTPDDLALRAKLASLDARLLYLHHGPAVLAACPFCAPDDPRSYLYYALPDLLAPHLFNLVVVAAATSPALTGGPREGAARWRTPATLVAAVLACADLYRVAAHNPAAAAAAAAARARNRPAKVDAFFWRARAARLAALAALDAVLAALAYLSGTRRAFAGAPRAAERVESLGRLLAATRGKVNAAGVVKNTVLRDEELRGRSTAYWAHEVRLMREMMEEREVVEGVQDALANRIDIRGIERDAEAYAKAVLMPGAGVSGTEEAEVVVG